MSETISMKADTGIIEVGGAATERPLRARVLDVFEDMAGEIEDGSLEDYGPYADRILGLIGTEIDSAIARERERCAKLADGDTYTVEHARNRIAGRIRGETP